MSDLLAAISFWEKNTSPQEIDRALNPRKQFFGRRIYLTVDSKGNCSIRSLNFIQRLVRKLFGCYRETHKKVLLNRIHKFAEGQIASKTALKVVEYFETRLKTSLFQKDPRKNRRTPQLALCDTIKFAAHAQSRPNRDDET